MFIFFCFVCLLLSKAQSETAIAFGDTVTQQVQKSDGKDGDKKDGEDDDDDDSGGGDNSGSGGNDSDDDDNSGSGNSGDDNNDDDGSSGGDDSNDDSDDNSGSGSGDNDSDNDNSGNGGDNGNSGSGNDNDDSDDDDNSGNGGNNGNGDNGNNGNGGNGNPDDSNDDDNDEDNSGKGNDDDSGNDNSGKGKYDDEPERRYYVGAVSASDGKSVLMGGTRLESSSPWLEVLSTGVWFEAYGYWQGNSFVAEDINILDNEAWSYFRGPASAVGIRANGNVEVWTKTSGVDTRLTSEEHVRLVAYFDGIQYRSLPAGLTPPTVNVPTGWIELTGTYDGQTIVWGEARAFP